MKSYNVTHDGTPEEFGPYALEVAFLKHGGINRVVASQIRAIRKAHTPEYLTAWLRQRGYNVEDLSTQNISFAMLATLKERDARKSLPDIVPTATIVLPMVKK